MSLLGKKFPAPVGMSTDAARCASEVESRLTKNSTARPMAPFYAAGMRDYLHLNWGVEIYGLAEE